MTNAQIIKVLKTRLQMAREENNPTEVTFLEELLKLVGFSNNLKPCPFCGNTNLFVGTKSEIEDESVDSDYYTVCCDYTSGGCGAKSGYRMYREDAIALWNSRKSNE